MQNDNYVIDKKRGINFGDPSAAYKWYEARLTEAQSALGDLMEILPVLLEICDDHGPLTSTDHAAMSKARAYVRIYEQQQEDRKGESAKV